MFLVSNTGLATEDQFLTDSDTRGLDPFVSDAALVHFQGSKVSSGVKKAV